MGRVEGKVAIITGGASGLGEADVRLLAAEGARVVITDINEEKGQPLADSLDQDVFFLRHDVSDEQQWIDVIAKTLSRFGSLDVLVNNAGVVIPGDVENTSLQDWNFVHDVCTNGTILGCKHSIPVMNRTGGGSIINISSISSFGGYPALIAYATSKGAVATMTKSVALHCLENDYKIRCNSVHPGRVNTPLLAQAQAGRAAEPGEFPIGETEDVANMVLFLASDESKFVNGAEMVIDGGTVLL